ncbi:MFS alpha-glucoside [Fusarium oxysporum f. sp. phaseoli]
MSKVPASKLRSKTVILVGMTYYILSILNLISNFITPYMLNPGAWALGSQDRFLLC